MTWLYVWLCILIFFLFLFSLNIKLYFNISDNIFEMHLKILFLKINLLRDKNKKKPIKSNSSTSEIDKKNRKDKKLSDSTKDKKKLNYIDFLFESLKSIKKPISKLFKKIVIDKVYIDIDVSHDDPAQTCILYGKTCMLVNSSIAFLKNMVSLNIDRKDIRYNFESDKFNYKIEFIVKCRIFVIITCLLSILLNIIVILIIEILKKKR